MNWVIILTRGVISVDVLPLDWELDSEGMATVIRRLKERLRDMLGADARLPTILMTDRGTGMHAPSGHVTRAYDNAVRQCGFQLFWGVDGKKTVARNAGPHLARDCCFLAPRGAQEDEA